MGKKNKKMSKGDFERGLRSPYYGPGAEAQKMLKRYGVEGTRGGGRAVEMTGKSYRGVDEVKEDLANAMMNDYDTRRSMEAAAMAGNKDAKKFAKKGFKAGNIQDAYGVMRDLKKEYVGGGGMDGAKNRAGLTHALVKADRNNFVADNDAKYASKSDLAGLRDEMKKNNDPGNVNQVTEGKSFNDYMKGTFGSKYEEIARGPAPYTDGDMDGGTSNASGSAAAAAAAQTNLADTVKGLSDVGAARTNKSKQGQYALAKLESELTGGY